MAAGSPLVRLVPRPTSAAPLPETLFGRYELSAAYDEMFEAPGRPRPQYRALVEELALVSPEELRRRLHLVARKYSLEDQAQQPAGEEATR